MFYYIRKGLPPCRDRGNSMQDRKAILCIIVIFTLLYSMFSLVCAKREYSDICRREAIMREDYAEELKKNEALRRSLNCSGSMENIEALARDRLGLVYPGEIVFYFTQK